MYIFVVIVGDVNILILFTVNLDKFKLIKLMQVS